MSAVDRPDTCGAGCTLDPAIHCARPAGHDPYHEATGGPRWSDRYVPAQPDNGQPWRVGRSYGLHVYEGDRPVATFHRPEDAERAVAAVNAVVGQASKVDKAADCDCGGTGLRRFDSDRIEACPVHLVPRPGSSTPRKRNSAVVQPAQPDDDGLRQRVQALAQELLRLARDTESKVQGDDRSEYRADQLGLAMGYRRSAIHLRRVLDGTSGDQQQDGAR